MVWGRDGGMARVRGADRARRAGVVLALLLALAGGLAAGPAAAARPGTYGLGLLVPGGHEAIEATSFRRGVRLGIAEVALTDYLPPAVRLALHEVKVDEGVAAAASGFNRLAADPFVLAVACCIRQATAQAMAAVAGRDRLALLLYGPGGGGMGRPPWIYSVAGWPGADEPSLARRLVRGLHARSVALFAASDDAAWRARAAAVAAGLQRAGVALRGTVRAPADAGDLAVPASRIAAARPDLLFVFAGAATTGTLVAALRAAGWSGQVAATDAIASPLLARRMGGLLDGIPFATDFSELATPAATHFARAYRAAYGDLPDAYAARGYALAWLVAQALRGTPAGVGQGVAGRAALAASLAAIGPTRLDLYGGETMRAGQLVVRARRLVRWGGPGGLEAWTAPDDGG